MLALLGVTWLKGQAWCGSAMAYWMQKSGLPYPKDFYRAKSWATYGVDAGGPVLGAIAVKPRAGGNHVCIVDAVGYKNGVFYFRATGGNQGDAVKQSWFLHTPDIVFRLPHGIESTEKFYAQVGEVGVSEA
jgi:uncharacterized protein (TIGR02594 family)